MASIDPAELSGLQIELGQLTGDELLAPEAFGQDLVETLMDHGQWLTFSAIVSIAADRQRRSDARCHAMAHGVHDGHVDKKAVDGVVETVTTHVIRRLQQTTG